MRSPDLRGGCEVLVCVVSVAESVSGGGGALVSFGGAARVLRSSGPDDQLLEGRKGFVGVADGELGIAQIAEVGHTLNSSAVGLVLECRRRLGEFEGFDVVATGESQVGSGDQEPGVHAVCGLGLRFSAVAR